MQIATFNCFFLSWVILNKLSTVAFTGTHSFRLAWAEKNSNGNTSKESYKDKLFNCSTIVYNNSTSCFSEKWMVLACRNQKFSTLKRKLWAEGFFLKWRHRWLLWDDTQSTLYWPTEVNLGGRSAWSANTKLNINFREPTFLLRNRCKINHINRYFRDSLTDCWSQIKE